MPSAQVIDRNPQIIPREDYSTLEKTLQSFSQRFTQNQQENRDTDALREIYSQYQQDGQNIQNAFTNIQTAQGISPTARVNATKDLLAFQKHNAQLQKDQKAQLDAAEKKLLDQQKRADLEKRRNLEPGALDAYEGDFATAERVTRPPKEPAKTQASQPIDEDQLKRIEHTMSQPGFNELSIPEQNLALIRNGVSKENSKAVIEPKIEAEKLKPGAKYSEKREGQIADYVESALQSREQSEEMNFVFDASEKAIKGEIQEPGVMALLKENPYGQLILGLTPDEATLQATNKQSLAGTKGIFGNKPTEREIFLLLNSMLPSIGKSKESNLASLYFLKKLNALKIMHGDLVEEISKGGYVPDIQSQVNQRMKPMVDEYREELKQGVKAMQEVEKSKPIKVKAPDGTSWEMTQEQIDAAREKNVIFTPA